MGSAKKKNFNLFFLILEVNFFFFFWISNKNILLKEEKYNWSIQEGTHQGPGTNQEHKVQKSKNP